MHTFAEENNHQFTGFNSCSRDPAVTEGDLRTARVDFFYGFNRAYVNMFCGLTQRKLSLLSGFETTCKCPKTCI